MVLNSILDTDPLSAREAMGNWKNPISNISRIPENQKIQYPISLGYRKTKKIQFPIFPGYQAIRKTRFPVFPGYQAIRKTRFPIFPGYEKIEKNPISSISRI